MKTDKNVRVNIIDNKKEKTVVHRTPPDFWEWASWIGLRLIPTLMIMSLVEIMFYLALTYGLWFVSINTTLFLFILLLVHSFFSIKSKQDEILAESKKKEDGGNY